MRKSRLIFLRVMKLLFVLMTVTEFVDFGQNLFSISGDARCSECRSYGIIQRNPEKNKSLFCLQREDLQQFQNLSVTAKNESVETVLQRVSGDKTGWNRI